MTSLIDGGTAGLDAVQLEVEPGRGAASTGGGALSAIYSGRLELEAAPGSGDDGNGSDELGGGDEDDNGTARTATVVVGVLVGVFAVIALGAVLYYYGGCKQDSPRGDAGVTKTGNIQSSSSGPKLIGFGND